MSLLAKTTTSVGCALLALPLLAVLVVTALFSTLMPSVADIPPGMLALYQRASAACPGLPWAIPAAIGKVETNHGRHPTMISSAGAVGPMQFLPPTFAAYAYPIPRGGKKPPTPWDPVDAVYAAVRLLCANGARNAHNLRLAIWHYNHSNAYVTQVLHIASTYTTIPTAPTGPAAQAVAFARAQLGTPYVSGGDGPADGGFDCSGLTQAAYRAAGITLPRIAQDQYNAGPHLPNGAQPTPGDLLFFGTNPHHITHVSLYTGHGHAIEAPHPGSVVRETTSNTNSPSFQGSTRPTIRENSR